MDSTRNKLIVFSLLKHLVIIALFFVVSVCDALALNGEGTKDKPYLVFNVTDWNDLRKQCSKSKYIYVELKKDITLSNIQACGPMGGFTTSGMGWLIAADKKFCGEFNGNNFTITVKVPNSGNTNIANSYFGLFGVVGSTDLEQTVIKNLKVTYSSTKAIPSKGFGTIVGEAVNTKIDSCIVENTNFTNSNDIPGGGIVAKIANGEVTNCIVKDSKYNFTTTSTLKEKVGGICSEAIDSKIVGCSVINTNIDALNASGLVAVLNGGVLKESFFAGGALGKPGKNIYNSGGICGSVQNSAKIYNCYSRFTVNVAGLSNFGNLVGELSGGSDLVIQNCYATGSVSYSSIVSYGSAIGKQGTAATYNMEHCYVKDGMCAAATTGGVASDNEKDEAYMKSAEFVSKLDEYATANKAALECTVTPVWYEGDENINESYPILRTQKQISIKTGCDEVEHEGVTYTESTTASDGTQIVVNKSDSLCLLPIGDLYEAPAGVKFVKTEGLIPNCYFWDYKSDIFKTVGRHKVDVTTTAEGCPKFSYFDIDKLASAPVTMDSVYVMTLDNLYNPYVYTINTQIGGEVKLTYSVSVGTDYVVNPTDVPGTVNIAIEGKARDKIKYSNTEIASCSEKDSITIKHIQYVSPIKVIEKNHTACEETDTVVAGEDYHIDEDRTIVEVKEYTTEAEIKEQLGDSYYSGIKAAYEVIKHNYKVKKIVDNKYRVESHSKEYNYEIDPSTNKLCNRFFPPCNKTTEDNTYYVAKIGNLEGKYYYTLAEAKAGCPDEIITELHTVCADMVITKDTIVCGKFEYVYAGDGSENVVVTSSKNGVRVPKTKKLSMSESCTGKGYYKYNITVNPKPEDRTSNVHGCTSVDYVNKKGETVTFTGTGEYRDVLEAQAEGECDDVTIVKYVVHPATVVEDNYTIDGCDEVEYTYFDGHKETFTESTTFTDMKKFACAVEGCACIETSRNVVVNVNKSITKETEKYKSCDKYEYNGKVFRKDTAFVVEQTDPNTGCSIKTPVEIKINYSSKQEKPIVACDKYVCEDGWETTESASHNVIKVNENGCKDTVTYNVTIATRQVLKDTTVYGCDEVSYKKLDGTTATYTENTTFVDELSSDECDGVGITQNVIIKIEKTEIKDLAEVSHCGSMIFTVPSQQKKIVVKESCVISDTTYTEHGCMKITRTPISIKPVNVKYDTVVACKTYNSFPYFKYENGRPNGYATYTVEDASIVEQDFVFASPTTNIMTSFGCLDTTYRHVIVHGLSESTLSPITACDEYVFEKLDGTTEVVSSSKTITDVLKSKTCDCDSIKNHVDIIINKKSPYDANKVETLPSACDSVVYERGTKRLAFYNDDTFRDTLVNKFGCDSVVNFKVKVNHSQLNHKYYTVCRDTVLEGIGKVSVTGVYRHKLALTPEGCDNGIEYHVTVNTPEIATKNQNACGRITFNGIDYTSENNKVNEVKLNLQGKTKCDPDTLFTLSVYPTYNKTVSLDSCFQVTYGGVVYTESANKIFNLKTVNAGCDSIINLNVKVYQVKEADSITTVSSLYLDSEYKKDTIIYENRVNEHGCEYVYTKKYTVIPPVERFEDVNICRRYSNPNKGLAIYKGVTYKKDTTFIVPKRHDKTNNDTLLTTNIIIHEPQHEYVELDSCMQVTYMGSVYTSSTELVLHDPTLKTKEYGCDSVVHIAINVEKCFPYPVLVNKYDWILICNDNIMTDDMFRKLSGVKYNWYKNNEKVAETTDNYYTENVPLKGCYYVGVVTKDGSEYVSDEMCFDESFSISIAPNPVETKKPITIECNFAKEEVEGTIVEVYNAVAVKVFETVATSSTIYIPGQPTAGHYFVKLITVSGNVITAKFVVK